MVSPVTSQADRQHQLDITRRLGGLDALDATVVSYDRVGFVVRVRTAEGMKRARIAIPEPVASREDARTMFGAVANQSR